MERIQDYWNHDLVWERIKPLQPQYELRAGEVVVARLLKGLVGSKGDAQTTDGHWIIKREGIIRTRVVVKESQSQSVVATIPWGKSAKQVLELPDGSTYKLVVLSTKGGHIEAGFINDAEELLLSVRAEGFAGGHKGIVKIEPLARQTPDLSLLVCANWYVILQAIQDAGAMAGGLSAAG